LGKFTVLAEKTSLFCKVKLSILQKSGGNAQKMGGEPEESEGLCELKNLGNCPIITIEKNRSGTPRAEKQSPAASQDFIAGVNPPGKENVL
jgi:hypothetical protein